MILLSMKTYLVLPLGISVLFSMESRSASIPETSSSISSTAEPNKTTKQLTSAHVLHSETETQPASRHPTHSPAKVDVAAAAETTESATVETKEAVVSDKSDSSTAGLVVLNTEAATTSGSGPRLPHTSTDAPAVTTAASEAQPSHNMTISETAKPTQEQKSPTTSTDMTAPATAPSTAPSTAPEATVSETSSVTAAVSSPMSTYITEHNVTIKLYSTTSSDNSIQAIQNFSSPSAFSTTATSTNTTSEASHVFDPDSTSSPVTINETSTASSELSSTPQPVSATRSLISTSHFLDTARPSSTTESHTSSISTDSANSTTAVSTSLAGILIPHVPKRLPIPTNESTPATTTAPRGVSKSPPGTEVKPCSIHGVVKNCLIAIASLAGLATIFMVTTIVLCTKLSVKKYKVKKPQHETEMICISSLLPERTYNYTRQRNPVTNGVLVMPYNRDSDEDGGDDLTLSSFIPDHDRFT